METNLPAEDAAPARARTAPLVAGPIGRTLVLFSLPILASNVLQTLNASINAAWIGRLLGPRALSASTNANAVLFLMLSISFGLSMAASILVGQGFGARNFRQIKRVMGTSSLFFAALSLVLAAAGFAVAPLILRAMATPPDAAALAVAYLQLIFLAIPPIFLFTFLMMAQRGAGDSRTPFFFLLLATVLDTALNPLLIEGGGPVPAMGIAGSAVATGIAQWISLAGLVFWLYRQRSVLRIARGELHYFRLDREILRSLLWKGVPIGLQVVVVSTSMILMISLVDRYGSLVVAAYGASFQLWNYIQMPSFAVGAAVSAMAAQNVGAGRWDRVNQIALCGVIYLLLLTGALLAAVAASRDAAFSLFLGQDMQAVAIARHMNLIVSWSFLLFGIGFILASVVRATGAVVAPLLILIISVWGIRLPAALWLSRYGVDGLLWSFPVGAAVSVFLTLAYYRFGPWRSAKMLEPERA